MWVEGDLSDYPRLAAHPQDPVRFPAMAELDRLAMRTVPACLPERHAWILQLPEYFQAEGLVDTMLEKYEVPSRYSRAWTEMKLLVTEEAYRNAAKDGVVKEIGGEVEHSLSEILDLIGRAGEEMRMGAVNPKLKPLAVVGRKPLNQG